MGATELATRTCRSGKHSRRSPEGRRLTHGDRRMTRWTGCVMLAALLWAAPLQAATIFTLLPGAGSAQASPGDTVGWGYEIVNDDLTNWLVISSFNSDGFQFGTLIDAIFDFPIL